MKGVVQRDCADAYEEAFTESAPFGRTMLEQARRRFRRRLDDRHTPLFDCLEEHMEGFGYVLTNQCKIWWSVPFKLEE